jgi:hypothetical protein
MSASTRERGSGSTVVRWVFLTIAVVLGIGYARHQYADATKRAEAEKTATQIYAAAHPPPAPVMTAPTKLRATTPVTLSLDYGFSLEADGPIMVQYPGEKPFLFNPGGEGCQQLPQPRNSGPKKFWDPKDPDNGHISFRIYRGNGEC